MKSHGYGLTYKYSSKNMSQGFQMRDALNRAGISRASPHRPDHRSGQPNRPGKPSTSRTARASNLKRLANELEFDLLSAALGVSETALRNLAADRATPQEEHCVVHISQKLQQIGMPSSWLDQPNARVFPDNLTKLRRLASASDSKSAIRRSNLKTLVDAFPERIELLSDAIELSVQGISQLLDGRLEFDDQRFGHVNPRLVAAGFPDGWLEQSDAAALTDAMKQGLESLAVDGYEKDLSELDETPQQSYVDQGYPVETTTLDELNEEEMQASAEQISLLDEQTGAEQSPAQPASAQSTTLEEPSMPKAQGTGGKKASPGQNIPPFARSAGHKAPTSTAADGNMNAARVAGLRRMGAKATRGPGARPAAAPVAATKKAAAASKTAVAAKKAHAAKTAHSTTPATKTTAAKTTAAKTAPATSAGKAAHKKQAAVYVRGQEKPSIERSQARVAAVDQLLENSRRGAKVTLWRSFLGKSLPFAGNIRRGTANFTDEMADQAEKALGLPQGWLDAPVFPTDGLAAWVNDESVPLPSSNGEAGTVRRQKRSTASASEPVSMQMAPQDSEADHKIPPFAVGHRMASGEVIAPPAAQAAPAQSALFESSTAAAAQDGSAGAPRATAPVRAAAAPAPAAAAAAPAQAAEASAPARSPAPAASLEAPAAAPGFSWKPAAHPKPVSEPGVLTHALTGVLLELNREGAFTDDDALRLINYLKSA